MANPKAFGLALTKAIYRIATEEQKHIRVVHDELGYALGREETAGSAIEYWRKGYIPAQTGDLERLAEELYRRGGLPDRRAIEEFLQYAGYRHPRAFCDELMAGGTGARRESAPPAPSPAAMEDAATSMAAITIAIEGDLPAFTAERRQRLIALIAAETQISPQLIRVVRMIPGSIRITVELPAAAARQFMAQYQRGAVQFSDGEILEVVGMEEPLIQRIRQIAAAIVRALVFLENLEALDLAPDAPDLLTLRRNIITGLEQYDDPLLPAGGFTLDDPAQRTALQAYLEIQMERDATLLTHLETLLREPSVDWSQQQHMAALVSLIARASYRELERVPSSLLPALRHFVQDLRDPWQVALPPRWLRWLPFGLRGAAEQRSTDPDAQHVQMIHAAVVAFLQMDPGAQAAALADPEARLLVQQATAIAQRIQLSTRERAAFVTAYVQAIQQASELVSAEIHNQA